MEASVFKQRFIPCSHAMYWMAYRLTGNVAEAEDLVQEVFLKLWTQRSRLPEMDNAEAYCIRMVRNLYTDRCRTSRLPLTDTRMAEQTVKAEEDVAARTEQCDFADKARRLIARLPEQQRTVMTLKDVEGRSYEEVAAATGLTQGNLRVILSRARKSVRRFFEE